MTGLRERTLDDFLDSTYLDFAFFPFDVIHPNINNDDGLFLAIFRRDIERIADFNTRVDVLASDRNIMLWRANRTAARQRDKGNQEEDSVHGREDTDSIRASQRRQKLAWHRCI